MPDPANANRNTIYLALHMFSCLRRHVPNSQIAGGDEIRVGFLKDPLFYSCEWEKKGHLIVSKKICIKNEN